MKIVGLLYNGRNCSVIFLTKIETIQFVYKEIVGDTYINKTHNIKYARPVIPNM